MRVLMLALALTAVPAIAAGLNDTGITTYGNGTWNGYDTDPGGTSSTGYPGQDARFGRDAAAAAGKLSKTGAGAAGFDFTKLGSDGQPLAIQNQGWSRDGSDYDNGNESAGTKWSCVRDNITGLIWEVKTNTLSTGLHAWDSLYTWYNSNNATNGGSAGTDGTSNVNNDKCMTTGRCDTEKFVADVNAAGLCGATSGWRLPTRLELNSIVHHGTGSPAIDEDYFPNTRWDTDPNTNRYWTSTPLAEGTDWAWYVNFTTGAVDMAPKVSGGFGYVYANYYVRLVHSAR